MLKNKVVGKKNLSGRNNLGKITVFHKGSGVKKSYRYITFKRPLNSIGIICSIEYDPYRTAYIASLFDFINKNFYYILAPRGIMIGDIIRSGLKIEPSLGSSLPIVNIPIGISMYSVSTKPSKPAQISRSAGAFSVLKEKTEKSVIIKLTSGEQKHISTKCVACIGEVSKEFHFLTKLGKAGCSRWLNRRPTVRGVAMNPIDHPHGGGEGKKSGRFRTPWGKITQKRKVTKK